MSEWVSITGVFFAAFAAEWLSATAEIKSSVPALVPAGMHGLPSPTNTVCPAGWQATS